MNPDSKIIQAMKVKKHSVMGSTCAASFCRKSIDGTTKYYKFPYPSDTGRLKTWQKRLLASDGKNAWACDRHFSDEQFCYNSAAQRMELKRRALPDKNIVRRTRDPKDPLDAVCRLCLQRSVMGYQMIFPVWPNPDVPTAEDIAQLFGIVITPDDVLPRIVCVTCTTKINYIKRIRDQFRKNDAILKAKFVTKIDEAAPPPAARPPRKPVALIVSPIVPEIDEAGPPPAPRPPRKPVALIVSANHSRSDTAPKITAVASLGKNPVDIPSSAASGSNDAVLREAYGSVVYVQEGDTYQQFRIINSAQIMPLDEHEEVVSTSSVKAEPTDTESEDHVELVDTEILYAENDDGAEPETEQVKIEYQQLDFGSLQTEDDSPPEDLDEHPPEKKLRGDDKPFRYAGRIKVETDET